MEVTAAIKTVDLTYYVFFKEPRYDLVREEKREALFRNIVKAFNVRLNDLKFFVETPSNNYVHFSKFRGTSFFDVSYGLEEVTAQLRNPVSKEQIFEFYGALNNSYEGHPITAQRVTVQYHLAVEHDIMAYLNFLNPFTPSNFGKLLTGKGISYSLKIEENQLKIYIVLAPSLFVPGGLFLSTDYEFRPNLYTFNDTTNIVEKWQNFIMRELTITIQR